MGKIQIQDGQNDAAPEPVEIDAKPVKVDPKKVSVDSLSAPSAPTSVPVAKKALTPMPFPSPRPNPSSPPSPTPVPAPKPESSDPLIEEQNVFEAASHEIDTDTDYSELTPLRKPKKSMGKIFMYILAGIICIGGVAAGGYVLMKQKNSSKASSTHSSQSADKKSSSNSSTSTPTPAPTNNNKSSNPSSGTKDYTSDNLKVAFSYPNSWTVDDSGDGKLAVTSPSMELTDASGQKQTGEVVLKVENQASADMSDFKKGSAAAVLDSEKITYSNPAAGQRANSYISFVQYSTTTTKGGLDGIYITGNLGYKYAQTITESDIAKIDPLVRVVFVKCSDSKCSSTTPLTISSDMWKSSDFSDPITNMLKSMKFE